MGHDLDTKGPVKLSMPTTAYDGEVRYDLILSYGWLAQHDVLVNPRRHGLLVQEKNRMVWVPGHVAPKGAEQVSSTMTPVHITPMENTWG